LSASADRYQRRIGPAPLNFGDLRRTTPTARAFDYPRGELSKRELDEVDPDFVMLITARAQRSLTSCPRQTFR
jgi:hypothetical protein